jgi:hypothetical protein
MFSMSSTNQILNIVLAMCLAALATAASMELRSQSLDAVASQLLAGKAELKKSDERIVEQAADGEAAAVPTEATEARANEDAAGASTEGSAGPIMMAVLRSRLAPDTDAEADAAPVPAAARGKDEPEPKREKLETLQAVVGGAVRAPAEPKEATLASLPAKAGIIFEDVGHKVCIGGMLCEEQCKIEAGSCEAKPAYVLKLDRPAYLSAIQLFAHDGVGPSRRAELVVKVNGEPVGSAEVHRYGSTRTIKIGRTGQLVTVESRHQHNGFLKGGEEAVIWDLYLFGREPR